MSSGTSTACKVNLYEIYYPNILFLSIVFSSTASLLFISKDNLRNNIEILKKKAWKIVSKGT